MNFYQEPYFFTKIRLILTYFQANFCGVINAECPSKSDFEEFDENGDGTLTWDEYLSHSSINPRIE